MMDAPRAPGGARRLRALALSGLFAALAPLATHQPPVRAEAEGEARAAGARETRARAADAAAAGDANARMQLFPTAHPPLPSTADDLWLVPARAPNAAPSALMKQFADGLDLVDEEDFAGALTKFSDRRLARTPVAEYAAHYTALAQLRTGRLAEARTGFNALNASRPPGVLKEWALVGEAEAAEAQGQFADAARLYEMASTLKAAQPDVVLSGLGRTLAAAGEGPRALAAFRRVYYEYPLSALAEAARTQMLQLSAQGEPARLKQDFALELKRAEQLFGAKRYAEALSAFEALRGLADDDEGEMAALRIAESQFYLGRYQQAADNLRPFVDRSKRKAEARFFSLSALRGAGNHDAYVSEARRLVKDFPKDAWAEETLNNLGTHYILVDEDDTAIEVFAEYLERFPQGRHAQRAAWKLGWARYRQQRYAETVAVFEKAAAAFPRSDYRPSWLYWSARAYDQLSQTEPATARYALIAVDYLHSYYGRLADTQLRKRGVTTRNARRALTEPPSIGTSASAGPTPSPSSSTGGASAGTAESDGGETAAGEPAGNPLSPEVEARIRRLIAAGLHAPAIAELECARRELNAGPVVDATLAWLYKARGELRRGINVMKRAYPQYLTDEGSRLPEEARKVLFPIDYWSLIRKHAQARGLDPYLIAALVAQESTFTADIRSPANAYGLMQVLPTTGRQLARSLGIRRFSIATLTNPEQNVRLGTLYFQRLVKQFGGTHYALASYNAGENRVEQWIAERPPLPQDEFIDDIPYPETQNYVKRILGTAEDYRHLYGN